MNPLTPLSRITSLLFPSQVPPSGCIPPGPPFVWSPQRVTFSGLDQHSALRNDPESANIMFQKVAQHQLEKKSKPQDPKGIKQTDDYVLDTYCAEGPALGMRT